MYIPTHFAESDIAVLHAMIRQHPLGTWVTQGTDELIVNHIPFFLDPARGRYGTLVGHIARANPVWKTFSTTVPSLIIFQGEQAYISPSWYPGKQTDGKVVPTWNYVVTHAQGIPEIIDDNDRVLEIVTTMSEIHEASQTNPWKVSDAPAAYINAMLAAIVGIEIPLTKLTGKWKLSQNRQDADKLGVISGLQSAGKTGADDMALQINRFVK